MFEVSQAGDVIAAFVDLRDAIIFSWAKVGWTRAISHAEMARYLKAMENDVAVVQRSLDIVFIRPAEEE